MKTYLFGKFEAILAFTAIILTCFIIIFTKTSPSRLISNNPPTNPSPTSTWKTYSNSTFNYSLKYPSNYFINISDNTLKISDDQKFESNENTLVFTIKPLSTNELHATLDPEILKLVDDIGYSTLYTKYPTHIFGRNFLGDPPWGNYIIYFSSNPGTAKYQLMKLSIRIHRTDDMPISEGGTAGQQKQIVKSILSTLKFTQ